MKRSKEEVALIFALLLFMLLVIILGSADAAHGKVYSKTYVWRTAYKWAVYMHVPHPQWAASKCLRIAIAESHLNSSARNGGCVGMLQFNRNWRTCYKCSHGFADWRKCGPCSIKAFMWIWKSKGTRAIRRHWRATW